MRDSKNTCDVAVIGAGIIGVSCALYLREAGQDVVLLDQNPIASGASSGNAGALAFTEILPLAAPGIMRKAMRWLFDPLGPLSLPPAYLLHIAPWLLRLWRASWSKNYQANIGAQFALMQLAQSEMLAMLQRCGLEQHLHTQGVLELYDSAASFARARNSLRELQKRGIEVQILQEAQIAERQPGLAPGFKHGVYLPQWQNVADPKVLAEDIAQYALDKGAVFRQDKVIGLKAVANDCYELKLTGVRHLQARKVVVAAGAFAHVLCAQLGESIPLETERGYNTTLAPDAFDLRQQLTFVDHAFVVAPLKCGLRVGGAVELAGLQRAPNYARADAMLAKAKKFLPGLDTSAGRQWMGMRPSLPDSLPAIGPARHHPNVVYAFGHGHLGLTQAAATACLVRELVLGQSLSIDIQAYSPQRF